jgi:hypothetical protein
MKSMKKILIVICIILTTNFLEAQITPPPEPPASSDQQNTSNKKYWIEYKNGRFKSSYNLFANGTERLVLETKLYDTGKGGPPPTIILVNDDSNLPFDNSQNILPAQKNIYISPSIAEVVAGDMMVLAVTYRAAEDSIIPGVSIDYSVILLYNQDKKNTFFNEISPGSLSGSSPTDIRYNNSLSVVKEKGLVADLIKSGYVNTNDVSGYKYYVSFKRISPGDFERNLFISMTPSKDLKEGDFTSLRALLIRQRSFNGDTTRALKDSFQLDGMAVALAHDPNYLRVSPLCIQSNKTGGHTINYKLHFQNTGDGAADTVIVTINLPKGMDLDHFNNTNISKAVYGGQDFKTDLDLISIDKNNNKLVFKFNPYKRRSVGMVFLKGADECVNPFADQGTMGDIAFSIVTTDEAANLLNATASIEFHSKAYSDASSKFRNSNRYEFPIETNIAAVKIKESCDSPDCTNCPPPGCYKIAALCWWWWVIIFGIFICIYIILRKRKKDEDNP